jgi:hypothetical protein
MSVAKVLARYALFVVFAATLTGCAYDTASAGGYGPYAANDLYGEPYQYDGLYGPDFFVTGAGHFHRNGFGHGHLDHFGNGFHPGPLHAGFGGSHFGGIHMAHGGGFGGHGRA